MDTLIPKNQPAINEAKKLYDEAVAEYKHNRTIRLRWLILNTSLTLIYGTLAIVTPYKWATVGWAVMTGMFFMMGLLDGTTLKGTRDTMKQLTTYYNRTMEDLKTLDRELRGTITDDLSTRFRAPKAPKTTADREVN